MKTFAVLSDDNVLRSVVRAEDMTQALEKFAKLVNNKSISDTAIAMSYDEYKKTQKK